MNWRSNAKPPREDVLSIICGEMTSTLLAKLTLLPELGVGGPSLSSIPGVSVGRTGVDDDFAAALRDLGVRGGSDPGCLLVAELVFVLQIATPWRVRSGVEGHALAASTCGLADSSSRTADGGPSPMGPTSLSAVYPESLDIADRPLALSSASFSLLSLTSAPSCLSFSNLWRSEDFRFPLPGRFEFCLERTEIRELVDFCDGVGDGGTLSAAAAGSEEDGTLTSSAEVWGGSGSNLGRASIVTGSGAATLFFDAPQPILNRTKDAANKGE